MNLTNLVPRAAHAAAVTAVLTLCAPCVAQDPTPTPDPEAPTTAVAIGRAAPTGRLNDHTGRAVSIGPSERWTVLAFYPKAATPG